MVDKKAVVDPDRCVACGNCEQRCESRAIMLEKLERPRILSVPVDDLPRQ
jgi:NAD-dependent dihydropyrimidine dehydrogenase PreA subunit